MQYFSGNIKNLTIQKLSSLKAHCLFAIKVYETRNLMYKLNQDTCNIMINPGNTLNLN